MKVLITGGTHGMGEGVARALAGRRGVELIVLGRSAERLEQVRTELAHIASEERVSVVRCDLSRMSDVRAAVAELRERHPSLDGIFVNAGLGYAPKRVITEDGMLEHFQVNYLSQFALTLGLLDRLEASTEGGRVVFNVTDFGALDLADLSLERGWTYERAVGLGMVAKHMFYRQLHRRYAAQAGPRVSCFGFQIPKTVWSNQLEIIPAPMKAMATVAKWLGQFISIDECGAIMAPLFVESASESLARSGRFLTSKNGAFVDVGKCPASGDPNDWERLWTKSLELSGLAGGPVTRSPGTAGDVPG